MVDIPSGLRACVGKKFFDHVGRHFLQQIRGVVGHQVVDDTRRILFRHAGDEKLLAVHLQMGKNVRGKVLG